MEFLTLLSRTLHLLSLSVWLGGMFYQRAIFPSTNNQGGIHTSSVIRTFNRSFVRVSNISLGILLLSGIFLMLSDPRFSLFSLRDKWSTLLLFKQLIFILILFFAYGYQQMLRYLTAPSSNGGYDERAYIYRKRVDQYQTLAILLGITALIFGTAMYVYG